MKKLHRNRLSLKVVMGFHHHQTAWLKQEEWGTNKTNKSGAFTNTWGVHQPWRLNSPMDLSKKGMLVGNKGEFWG
jgi:hypothetical protein